LNVEAPFNQRLSGPENAWIGGAGLSIRNAVDGCSDLTDGLDKPLTPNAARFAGPRMRLMMRRRTNLRAAIGASRNATAQPAPRIGVGARFRRLVGPRGSPH
jgi:hypothetical protein